MKKLTGSLKKGFFSVIAVLVIIMVTSCDLNSSMEEEFLNPDGFTDPTIEGTFAGLQQTLGIFRYAYGEFWHSYRAFNPMLGTGGFNNDGTINQPGWGHQPYTDLFNKLRIAQNIYNFYEELPEQEKQDYEIYIITTDIIADYLFYHLTDALGDVPYSEALGAWDDNFFPKFDRQEFIYEDILGDLEEKANLLDEITLNESLPHRIFPEHDVWFEGDLGMWKIFVNSLRMRLAMRLTNVNEELAQSVIQDVLADGDYVTSLENEIIHDDRRAVQDALSVLIWRSMQESRSVLFMPEGMDIIMRKEGMPEDPRLKVLFQPDINGEYTPMPREAEDIANLPSDITTTDLTATYPSLYNRTTFEGNFSMPYLIITAAEIHLIKAEAALRWGLGLDAVEEYGAAIQTSIDRYYEINAMNNFDASTEPAYNGKIPESQPEKADEASIQTFITAMKSEFASAGFSEQLGLIYDQKYVHFNILKPYELWSDTRRLYTELGDRVLWKPSNQFLFERMIYPSSEAANNRENYVDVADADNFITPVWWTGRSTPISE